MAAEASPEDPPGSFDVVDLFEGLFRLEERSPTLDGSVPLRVAQGCAPLLAGNAYGHQLTLSRAVVVGERLGRLRLEVPDELARELRRLAGAALPRLVAHGLVERDGPWHRALARGVAAVVSRRRLALFTGLLLRPSTGLPVRVTGAANRRNTRVDVEEQLIGDEGRFVPLLLTIGFPRGASPAVTLAGEIACLAPLRPGAEIARRALREVPAAGRAHADFYDASYFAAKKDGVTGKYRRLVTQEPGAAAPGRAAVDLVEAGPVKATVGALDRVTTAAGPVPVARAGGPAIVTFRNLVAFSALFDGHTLAIEPDRAALARAAREIERVWDEAIGAGFVEAHRGALWYLTKYFTPHTPGEPHFFVKPAALTVTPAGWSCVVDGLPGDGYDVLRGVVSTDVFHATPAVFRLWREGAPIHVAEGEPLLRVIPFPRALLSSGWRAVSLDDAR